MGEEENGREGIKLWSAIDKLEEDISGMPKLLIQGHSRKSLNSSALAISTTTTLGSHDRHTGIT